MSVGERIEGLIDNQRQYLNTLTFQPTVPEKLKAQPEILTRTSRQFMLLTAFLLVVSVFDIPLIGISITAPLIGLVLLEVCFRSRYQFVKLYRTSLIWVFLFVVGLLIVQSATAIQEEFGLVEVSVPLIQYGFWVFTFVLVLYISHDSDLMKQIAVVFGVGIMLLGTVRLGEGIFLGKWGAWTDTVFMTQNSYGFQFSTFIPYGIYLLVSQKGPLRIAAGGMMVIVFFGALVNGSRGSWISVTVGLFIIGLVNSLASPKYLGIFLAGTIFVGLASIAVYPLLPDEIRARFEERVTTLSQLDSDKSFLVRELMIQKGLRLFAEDPLFGIGLGRFKRESVILDIPVELQYATQLHFNTKSSHNTYVGLLAETGLFGTVPFAALFLTAATGGLLAAVKLKRKGYAFAPFAYASFCGMSVHLWSLSGLTGSATWFTYGFVIGMIYLARSLPPTAPPDRPLATAGVRAR